MTYEGGCRCGAVRYRIDAEPLSAGFCQCRMCQRAVGSPSVGWAAFPRVSFRFVKGEPGSVRASVRAVRRFCRHCGGALTLEYSAGTTTIDVTVASLDDPGSTEPLYEIWTLLRQS